MALQTILFLSGFLAPGTGTFASAVGGAILDVRGAACVERDSTFGAIVFTADGLSFGDPWLVIMDGSGGVTEARMLGGDLPVSRELESGGLVEELPDGSLLVAAYAEPRATGVDADACIMKLAPDGTMVWGTVIGEDDDGVYRINGLSAFGDGSFVVTGSVGCGITAPLARIYDPEGRPLADLDPADSLSITCADVSPGGDAVISASSQTDGGVLLLRYSSSGAFEGCTQLPPDPAPQGYGSVEHLLAGSDGRLYLAWSGYPDSRVMCLSESGEVLWSDCWPGEGAVSDILELPGGSVACCGCSGAGSDGMCAVLALYDPSGAVRWRRLFEDGQYAAFCDVRATADGGFLLTGSRDQSGMDDLWSEALVVRADQSGMVDGCSPAGDFCELRPAFRSLDSPPHGWVIACGVYESPEEARTSASHAADASFLEPGVLWIPVVPSLSGYRGWLAYLVPEAVDGNGWNELCSGLLTGWPDAYLVWIGSGEESRSRALLPGD